MPSRELSSVLSARPLGCHDFEASAARLSLAALASATRPWKLPKSSLWRYAPNLVPNSALACEERRRGWLGWFGWFDCFVDGGETLIVPDEQADSPAFPGLDTAGHTSAVTVAGSGAYSAALAKGRWSGCVRTAEHWDIAEHTSW